MQIKVAKWFACTIIMKTNAYNKLPIYENHDIYMRTTTYFKNAQKYLNRIKDKAIHQKGTLQFRQTQLKYKHGACFRCLLQSVLLLQF